MASSTPAAPPVLAALRLLTISRPDDAWWSFFLVWFIRFLTVSVVLRTYIVPWGLRLLFSRFRVRSVSLRSIRGVYFRQGRNVWNIDRIGLSYHRPSKTQASHLTVVVQGLKLDIATPPNDPTPPPPKPTTVHRRRPTLADFSPSPIASKARELIYALYSGLEPYFRPLVRAGIVFLLRVLIKCLPTLTQVLDFELDSAELSLAELPDIQFKLKELGVSTKVVFTQVEKVAFKPRSSSSRPLQRKHSRFLSMADWKLRLSDSVSRTWAGAWGNTRGTAALTIHSNDLSAVQASSSQNDGNMVFHFPSSNFHASLDINSQRGIEPHSLEATIGLESINLTLDLVQDLIRQLKLRKPTKPPPSTSFQPSPFVPTSPTLFSPMSPSLQFMSLRRDSATRKVPKTTLLDTLLASVKLVRMKVATINLQFRANDNSSMAMNLQKLELSAGLSDPDEHPLHREILGRSKCITDVDSEVYSAHFSTDRVAFQKIGRPSLIHGAPTAHSLVVATVGKIRLDALASQLTLPSMSRLTARKNRKLNLHSGDPNSAVLALRAKVTSIDITHDWESIRDLILRESPRSAPSTLLSPDLQPPVVLSPQEISPREEWVVDSSVVEHVPRVHIDVEVGSIKTNIPFSSCAQRRSQAAVEMKTAGVVFCLDSDFVPPPHRSKRIFFSEEATPIRMRTSIACNVEPLELGVRVGIGAHGSFDAGETSETSFEPLLIVDTLNISANGMSSAMIKEDGVTVLDISSTFLDLHSSTDAISVELWHPEVVSVLSEILDTIRQRPKQPPPHPWSKPTHRGPHLLDRLPVGVAASVAIDRFTAFATSPDLNPTESADLARGIAFHTGFSIHFCSILPCHVPAIGKVSDRHQTRHKLYLPEEPLIKSINKTTSRSESDWTSDVVRFTFWDTGIRSAISTTCVADDPYCLKDMTSKFSEQNTQFLSITSAKIDLVYPGVRAAEWSGDAEDKWVCEVGVKVPAVKVMLGLVHAYCALLATRGLKEIFGPKAEATRKPTGSHPPAEPVREKIIKLHASVHLFEFLFNMPEGQAIAARMNNFNLQLTKARTILLSWPSCFFWVPRLKGRSERLDGPVDHRLWEEFISMQSWDVAIDTASQPEVSITVQGEVGRVRIPHHFVFSELVLAIGLSTKSMKHLVEVVDRGKFREMDIPAKEDAKKVPKMVFKIRRLIAEAADDPFESKLGLISRASFKATEIIAAHEDAFEAKVATILAAESEQNSQVNQDDPDGYRFTTQHSVSIEEARQRLLAVHAKTWKEIHGQYRSKQMQWNQPFYAPSKFRPPNLKSADSNLVLVAPLPDGPPLVRLVVDGLNLQINGPSFAMEKLPDFLFDIGSGQPRDSEYSLLVPLNLDLSVSAITVNLRDYPLPLFAVKGKPGTGATALTFRTDLVIAEQMGPPQSVEWRDCVIVEENFGVHGATKFHFTVPKTIMPVKTYANPEVNATTRETTEICWGISYSYTVQDVMRILETLSSAPRDPSPSVGFWDKLRLVLHWTVRASFKGDVHLHIKGSRDPHTVLHDGAGFALCWSGNIRILIGQPNPDGELIQVISDSMSVAVPNFEGVHADADPSLSSVPPKSDIRSRKSSHRNTCELRKICAKLSSGVRFGVRFDLERSCGSECQDCGELPAFKRRCRHFSFRPHYDVVLETKESNPERKAPEDSYNGFRSDFIHMSLSLTSSVENSGAHDNSPFSNFHLTPKTFALFWHWVGLFDSRMSLPIRQGSYFQHKLVNPKLSQHIATIKYRITVPRLFISHVYPDEGRQSWSDGITRFVGMKALIDHFHADLHQRDEESTQFNPSLGTSEVVRHKYLHNAEAVLRGLHLRAMLGTFQDPVKKIVLPDTPEEETGSNKFRSNLPTTSPDSIWFDKDDFVELDWSSRDTPVVNLLRAAECPHFVYTKCPVETQNAKAHQRTVFSKFGNEDTHSCYLGKEPCSAHIQVKLVGERIEELRKTLSPYNLREETTLKMIKLLEEYAAVLSENQAAEGTDPHSRSYYIAADTVPMSEWLGFENVYQVHCPRLFLNESVRDILMEYYYCSRSRRGFEYQLATRAVKFIRDQGAPKQTRPVPRRSVEVQIPQTKGIAQAMQMLRQSFSSRDSTGGLEHTLADAYADAPHPGLDPLEGWKEGASLKQSHFCVLLKPQIVLHSELSEDSTCIVAAAVTKFKINNIMDNENADDPINGTIMSRTYIGLQDLQIFAPSKTSSTKDGCIPVEVLIDFRCESSDFDRLVPQTEATIRYDRFNRLRLRGSANMHDPFPDPPNIHLKFQTDLINVWVPKFTVSASDSHFSAISDIVTSLLLFSDPAHKSRLERLETLLFSYDFTDFTSSANVVSGLQGRLREAVNQEQDAQWRLRRFAATEGQAKLEMAKIRADVLALADELSYIFEAIRLAQDRSEGNSEHKSALLLLASSPEISWRMLDSHRDLLAKLSVNGVKFSWLTRQDSAVVNTLRIGDLHVFDGHHDAVWPEILCKHNEPKDHHLVRRDVFAISSWVVLAPVGGISIYEKFEVDLHPLRLQLDTKVGRRIMEYFWPARKNRRKRGREQNDTSVNVTTKIQPASPVDSTPQGPSPGSSGRGRKSMDHTRLAPVQVRRLGTSRSFTDLRSAGNSPLSLHHMNRSSDALSSPSTPTGANPIRRGTSLAPGTVGLNDAAIMKTRSAQKTFVAVDIASISVLLSIQKQAAFLLRDARINTRDLRYRNQTWSFEELVEQFIPSDPTWKGWVKMALHQPFFEVIPVARELISKTKRIASKSVQQSTSTITPRRLKPTKTSDRPSAKPKDDSGHSNILAGPYADEPEAMEPSEIARANGNDSQTHNRSLDRDRAKVTSMFRRNTVSQPRGMSGDLISSAHNTTNNTNPTIHSHSSNINA